MIHLTRRAWRLAAGAVLLLAGTVAEVQLSSVLTWRGIQESGPAYVTRPYPPGIAAGVVLLAAGAALLITRKAR